MSETNETDKIVKALNRIADAIQSNADSTKLLAMATAGEFDEEAPSPGGSLSDPL